VTTRAPEFEPIASYGMLSDCSSAALVSRSGSIDWLCLPRFDSPAVFARVLDPRAGHWSIRPAGAFEAERRYVPGTLVIETTFRTATGTARLTDALAFANGQRGHDLGLDAPHELLRSVEALGGKVEMLMELAPRPEYGLVRPLLRLIDGGARTFGGPNQIGLSSAVALVASDATVHARFTLSAGERAGFCLVWAPAESRPPQTCAPAHVAARIVDTVEGWRSWEADHDIYGGPRRELIRLSSRVLKGLSYRPMGAIVAAATTSLPEQVGSATGTTATRGSATRA
jgi:GH15 family glucan-1,4-alpha-glucosidase